MSNKYQEALNKIINHKCYERESSCWDYIKTIYKEETDTLQELIDNETPMKPPLKWEYAKPQTRCKCSAGVEKIL